MTTIETTTTALTTDREALRTAFQSQKEAAFAGLDELMKLADIGMKEYEDMKRPELSKTFRAINEEDHGARAALSRGRKRNPLA